MARILLDHLQFQYPSQQEPIFSDLSLSIDTAWKTALIGRNGRGKTTVLKAVSGILKGEEGEVTDGSINFMGEKINGLPPETIVRRGIFQVMEGRRVFEELTVEEVERLLGDGVRGAVRSDDFFADLIQRLKSYFAGKRVAFNDELDLSAATAFQRQVWRLTRLIPYGETRSYGWIAERLGRAGVGRAVGQALARNPLPIIVPCHRVVAEDGGLGGYSGGVAKKEYLLRLESAAKRDG